VVKETKASRLRNKRTGRKKTLFKKSYELAEICDGQVFSMYTDSNGNCYAYASNDQLWSQFTGTGIRSPSLTQRVRGDGNIRFNSQFSHVCSICSSTVPVHFSSVAVDTSDL
jgi:hypothetical protein